jgi:hypothetical protein
MRRRSVIQAALGIALGPKLMAATSGGNGTLDPGKPGDFNFLAGSWQISHRQLKKADGKPPIWDEFSGEATCYTLLNGVASIEELRIPARKFSGMGIRLLDVEGKRWADYWVNSKSGILSPPPMWGGFKNGAGIFTADDVDDGKPIKVRGIWDRITPASCRWRQGLSRDGGKTWEETWFMDWVRVAGP